MAKSKKKKSSKEKKGKSLFSSKKVKFLFKLVLLVALLVGGYVLYNPDIIEDESTREQVLGVRQQIEEALTAETEEQTDDQSNPLQKVMSLIDRLPKQISIGDQDIYLDQTVNSLTSQLEQLPAEQYARFKSSFCADVVATVSAVTQDDRLDFPE